MQKTQYITQKHIQALISQLQALSTSSVESTLHGSRQKQTNKQNQTGEKKQNISDICITRLRDKIQECRVQT